MKITRLIFTLLLFVSTATYSQDDVRIPNIMTPNGDNINDLFSIRSQGFVGLTCTIINRYGEPVYRYYGLNGTWDGFTHAGVKVSPGTYFVFVEFELESGEIVTKQGTLLVQY